MKQSEIIADDSIWPSQDNETITEKIGYLYSSKYLKISDAPADSAQSQVKSCRFNRNSLSSDSSRAAGPPAATSPPQTDMDPAARQPSTCSRKSLAGGGELSSALASPRCSGCSRWGSTPTPYCWRPGPLAGRQRWEYQKRDWLEQTVQHLLQGNERFSKTGAAKNDTKWKLLVVTLKIKYISVIPWQWHSRSSAQLLQPPADSSPVSEGEVPQVLPSCCCQAAQHTAVDRWRSWKTLHFTLFPPCIFSI